MFARYVRNAPLVRVEIVGYEPGELPLAAAHRPDRGTSIQAPASINFQCGRSQRWPGLIINVHLLGSTSPCSCTFTTDQPTAPALTTSSSMPHQPNPAMHLSREDSTPGATLIAPDSRDESRSPPAVDASKGFFDYNEEKNLHHVCSHQLR